MITARRLAILLVLSASPGDARAAVEIEHLFDIPSTCSAQTMTMQQDAAGRPFLYVAAKEGGLRVYSLSARPELVRVIPRSALRGLDVMNLAQAGNRLFLALGNHFSANQSPGLAVVDVSDPAAAKVTGLWSDAAARGGAGGVASEGGRVYLGAMGNGLIVFKLNAAGNPKLFSRFVPPLDFPADGLAPNPAQFNARGLVVRKGLVYLAYDAGGLRIIDASKKKPVEIGRYSNPALDGKPRAYNNVVLDGHRLYAAVDFCGLEALDVAKPAAIELLSWWNPWHCETSPWNWFSSAGHANEIALDAARDLVFLSTGKSDLQVVSIADPAHPEWQGEYGGVDNGLGTWGVSRHGDRVYLSYICTLGIPFASNWSGVKALAYDRSSAGEPSNR